MVDACDYFHRGVWQRIGERLRRPREVLTSDNDQTRCLNLPQLFNSERPPLSCEAGPKGFRVVSRSGYQRLESGLHVALCGFSITEIYDVASNSGEDQAVHAFWIRHGEGSSLDGESARGVRCGCA